MQARPQATIATRAAALSLIDREWRMLIDGEWVNAADGGRIDVYDPSTAEVVARAPAGKAADIAIAVKAARRAFDERRWVKLGAAERGRRLWRVADLLEHNTERLQAIEMLNNGLPKSLAVYFVKYAADLFRYYAGWCDKVTGITSDIAAPGSAYHGVTRKEPIGVAGLIVPWNGPLGAAAMKLAPALAAGCTCVLKPAEETPVSTLLLGELLIEAGIPSGVVNIVTGLGHEAGAALAAHPDVDKVGFTGSTEIGKRIVQAAAGNLKRVSLELGGKSPVIIFDDADLEKAIPGAALGTFYNTGQVCVAGTRVFVHRSLYEQVVLGISEVGRALRIGGAFDSAAQIGPLISAKQLQRVGRMIQTARSEGAHVLGGGNGWGGGEGTSKGYFIEPTVIAGASPDSLVAREEIFGPVLTVMPFDTPEEVVAMANATPYGLAAAVWTRDIARSQFIQQRVAAGTVWVNCQLIFNPTMPFGGYKQSGWGRECGIDGVDTYLQTKTVITALSDC